jgi:hypothetical protein
MSRIVGGPSLTTALWRRVRGLHCRIPLNHADPLMRTISIYVVDEANLPRALPNDPSEARALLAAIQRNGLCRGDVHLEPARFAATLRSIDHTLGNEGFLARFAGADLQPACPLGYLNPEQALELKLWFDDCTDSVSGDQAIASVMDIFREAASEAASGGLAIAVIHG